MRFAPLALLGGLLLGLTVTQVWAAASEWKVARPVAGNPLVEASIDGRADAGRKRAAASLIVACRADAPPASLSMRLPVEGLGFDLRPFEGPDGVGQRAGLSRLYFGRERGQSVTVNGWRTEGDRFQLSLHLPANEAQQLLKTHVLRLALSAADGKRGLLQLSFVLPKDTQPLKAVLSGCGV